MTNTKPNCKGCDIKKVKVISAYDWRAYFCTQKCAVSYAWNHACMDDTTWNVEAEFWEEDGDGFD